MHISSWNTYDVYRNEFLHFLTKYFQKIKRFFQLVEDIVNDPIRADHDISSLKYAIVGGAPATPALVRKANQELGVKMSVGYGMTENSCATFLTPPGSNEDVTCNTVGFPIPGVDTKIIDDEENTLEKGQIGELVTKGFVLFQGEKET